MEDLQHRTIPAYERSQQRDRLARAPNIGNPELAIHVCGTDLLSFAVHIFDEGHIWKIVCARTEGDDNAPGPRAASHLSLDTPATAFARIIRLCSAATHREGENDYLVSVGADGDEPGFRVYGETPGRNTDVLAEYRGAFGIRLLYWFRTRLAVVPSVQRKVSLLRLGFVR